MLAAQLHNNGFDGIIVGTTAPPSLAHNEVLVRVSTVGVNQLDLNVIAGIGPGSAAQLPRVLGIDPAGIIVAQGSAVQGMRIGERVVVKPNIPCGECAWCQRGNESDCPKQSIVGVHRDGGAAELVSVPSSNAFAIGDLDFALATAAVHSVPIALHTLRAAGGITPGERVLVTGASGAVGRAAAQLAVHFGAEVVAVTRSVAPLGIAGVHTVSYNDLADLGATLAAVAPDGFALALDSTGHAGVTSVAISALGWGGRMGFCAASVDADLHIDARDFYLKRKRLVGAASADFAEVAEAIALVRSGAVTPQIGSRMPLPAIVQGYRAFNTRAQRGKVVIDVG